MSLQKVAEKYRYCGISWITMARQFIFIVPVIYQQQLSQRKYFFRHVNITKIFSFLCNVLQIVICPFVFFLLVFVLSVLLRFTASNYPFDIFKLFLHLYFCIFFHSLEKTKSCGSIQTKIPPCVDNVSRKVKST